MAKAALRLRVDSPFPGESMSSFLSRAAQFYSMPVPHLLSCLLGEHRLSTHERRELDLEPSRTLEDLLAAAVRNWRSPAADHKGFLQWNLAPGSRAAYCPTCFIEDLQVGRTPYFRNDWIPLLVTTCWHHETPLFDWEFRYGKGWRRWPREWLYGFGNPDEHVPSFMQLHLRQLEELRAGPDGNADVGDGISLSQALLYLNRLQGLVEKPSAAPMPERPGFRSDLGELRSMVRRLVQLAAWYQVEYREPPLATALAKEGEGSWFGSVPDQAMPRHRKYLDSGLRQDGCIRWRRQYLIFVVRTLLRMERFSTLFPLESPRLAEPAWRDWWSNAIRPALGPNQRTALDAFMKSATVA